MNEFFKTNLFKNAVILVLIAFSLYHIINPRPVFENLKKLKKELKENNIKTNAKITKADKINSLIIDEQEYENGWLFTYIFDAKHNKYMGTFFLSTRKYEIEDSIKIIYLPTNPAVNQYVE